MSLNNRRTSLGALTPSALNVRSQSTGRLSIGPEKRLSLGAPSSNKRMSIGQNQAPPVAQAPPTQRYNDLCFFLSILL
jgi:hypothetical protein